MEDLTHLSKEQLADKIKDLVDNLNASRIIRDATITEPGGPPTANAIAEYTQQEAVISQQLRQCIELLLDPYRVVRNDLERDSFNRGGNKTKRKTKTKNKRNTRRH